jgi:hypothetical protein
MVYPIIIFEHNTFIARDLFDGGFILPDFDVVDITVDVSVLSPALDGGGGGAS